MVWVPDVDAAIEVDGRSWRCCSNRHWRCNWLVAEDADSAHCLSCALVRRRPDPDDTIAMEKLAEARTALRRLVFQLTDLGLPITPHYQRDGGLAFDGPPSRLFADAALLERAQLHPPPLWELSQRLGLRRPLAGTVVGPAVPEPVS